jgi:hypothetical protein
MAGVLSEREWNLRQCKLADEQLQDTLECFHLAQDCVKSWIADLEEGIDEPVISVPLSSPHAERVGRYLASIGGQVETDETFLSVKLTK